MEPTSNSKLLLVGGALALIVVAIGVHSITSQDKQPETKREASHKSSNSDEKTSEKSTERSHGPKVTSIREKSSVATSEGTVRPSDAKLGTSGFSGFHFENTTPTATAFPAPQVASTSGTLTPAPTVADAEEAKQNARKVLDLTSLFKNEKDPSARIDLADELGLIDDPAAVRQLLDLAKSETDPEVKEALLHALTGLDSLEQVGKEAVDALDNAYRTSGDLDVREAAQDALGDVASADSMKALRQMYADAAADPSEQLNAAENILRIRTNDPELLSIDDARAINDQLRLDFKAGTDPAYRSQAAMALALMGKENQAFFQQALTTEQDPNVKNLLEKLSKMQFGPQ